MSWLKAHVQQILVVFFSVLVALGLHYSKLKADEAIFLGSVLAAWGIHLPAIVYKVPPVVGAMLAALGVFIFGAFALALAMLACTKQTVAKDEYSAQLKACDDTSLSRSEDDNCKTEVRKRWDEAGAPAAALLDGGGQ